MVLSKNPNQFVFRYPDVQKHHRMNRTTRLLMAGLKDLSGDKLVNCGSIIASILAASRAKYRGARYQCGRIPTELWRRGSVFGSWFALDLTARSGRGSWIEQIYKGRTRIPVDMVQRCADRRAGNLRKYSRKRKVLSRSLVRPFRSKQSDYLPKSCCRRCAIRSARHC